MLGEFSLDLKTILIIVAVAMAFIFLIILSKKNKDKGPKKINQGQYKLSQKYNELVDMYNSQIETFNEVCVKIQEKMNEENEFWVRDYVTKSIRDFDDKCDSVNRVFGTMAECIEKDKPKGFAISLKDANIYLHEARKAIFDLADAERYIDAGEVPLSFSPPPSFQNNHFSRDEIIPSTTSGITDFEGYTFFEECETMSDVEMQYEKLLSYFKGKDDAVLREIHEEYEKIKRERFMGGKI